MTITVMRWWSYEDYVVNIIVRIGTKPGGTRGS